MVKVRGEAKAPAVAGLVVLAAGMVSVAGWVDWLAVGRWLQAHAGTAAVVVVGGALLSVAARQQWRQAAPRTPRALSWWVVAAGGVLVVAAAWEATAWLMHEASTAKDPSAARVEAVKTGLGIGASVGGVFALLLAARRQWHQELSAADTTHDATERRVTELYTKAADQLGSDKPAVRLAGLYALERVAQGNENQRQTVVNVLAAYLRMPFDPPGDDIPLPEDPTEDEATNVEMDQVLREYRERIQELEVRLAAQRILAKHLQPGSIPTASVDTFWENIDLDLTGAALVRWDLSGGHVRTATFDRATFTGFTNFDEARFDGYARFGRARFDGYAKFDKARFDGEAGFGEAEFNDIAMFGEVWFHGDADFDKAQFSGSASFHKAQFGEEWIGGIYAKFRGAQFSGDASFDEAQFGDFALFDKAQFDGKAGFDKALFNSRAEFRGARFGGDAMFDKALFNGRAEFARAQFAEERPPRIADDGTVSTSDPDEASSGTGKTWGIPDWWR